jgi:hypothetical protein
LHDSIGAEGSHCARSEATTSSSSPPPRHYRASPVTQLNQEGRLHTGRGVADEHGLANPVLDTFPIDEGEREQEELEQEKDEGHGEGEDEGPQQEVNILALAETAERVGGSPRPANRRQSLPNLEQSPEPNHNKAGSRSDYYSDDELNSTDSAEGVEKKPRPAKRTANIQLSFRSFYQTPETIQDSLSLLDVLFFIHLQSIRVHKMGHALKTCTFYHLVLRRCLGSVLEEDLVAFEVDDLGGIEGDDSMLLQPMINSAVRSWKCSEALLASLINCSTNCVWEYKIGHA